MRCANCLTSLTNLFAMPNSMPISLSSLAVESCKVCNVIASFNNFCFASSKLAQCPGVLSPVLFNYGSFDPFAAVDLGLTSQKSGRSPAMLRRERSILDQVQVRSILPLSLPEMVARNQIKPELQEEMSALSTSPPRQKCYGDNFHALPSLLPHPGLRWKIGDFGYTMCRRHVKH